MEKTMNGTVVKSFQPIKGELLDALSDHADTILKERARRERMLDGNARRQSILQRTAATLLNMQHVYGTDAVDFRKRKKLFR